MSSTSNIVMIVSAENKAGQTLQQVKQQVDQTGRQIEQTNARVAQSVQKVQANYLQATAGFATVGASATSLATSFSVLDKAQTAVAAQQTSLARAQDTLQRSTTDLESKQLALARAEEALNRLRERGLEGTKQFELAEQKLALAFQKLSDAQAKLKTDQQNVETITLRLRDAQVNLGDTYANFVAGLAPQMISMVFGLQIAFKALGITSVSQLVPAIHGVGAAMKVAFLTPPPIALIIAGVATVVALLVTNFGGFRDAVIQTGNEIFKFIQQHVKPLADLLSWLNVNIIQPVAQALDLTTVTATENAEQAFDELKQETIDLGHGIASTKQEIEQLIPTLDPGITTATQKVNEVLKGTGAIVARNVEQFGKMGHSVREAAEEVIQAANKTRNAHTIIAEAGEGIIQTTPGGTQIVTTVGGGVGGEAQARRINVSVAVGSAALEAEIERMRLEGGNTGRTAAQMRNVAVSRLTSRFPGVLAPLSGSTGLTFIPENLFAAQHGFEGIVNKPTLFLTGEAGSEHVKITPNSRGSKQPIHIHLEVGSREIAEVIINDIDELLTTKTIPRKLTTKGVRLQ